MRSVRSLSVVAALLLVAAACTSAKPGWTYAPAPSATPLPSVSASGSAGASASASASASTAPSESASASASASASGGGAGEVLKIAAQNIAYDTTQEAVPANTPFQIQFTNNDAGVPHNVAIGDLLAGWCHSAVRDPVMFGWTSQTNVYSPAGNAWTS